MVTENDIEICQVSKSFGKTVAVHKVDLQVRRGEFITLLGPSGCGKTTLLRMIAGFEQPTAGKILLGGLDVTNVPPYRRNVHTVFQQYALFPHRTVAGNIAFGLEQRGLKKAAIKEQVKAALDLVQLQGFEDRYPNQLSGGQQQRVAIARAVILEPRVLLLDEPLGALDLKLRKEMQVELKKLQRRLGISFVFVTHDQEEALVMSDRIAVMRGGHLEQIGGAQEIYERPRTEFVADFIGVSNIIEAEALSVAAGSVELRLPAATLRVPAAREIAANTKVKLAVRPEKIRFAAAGARALVQGVIEEGVYFGNSTHWRVRASDGRLITVFEQNRGDGALGFTTGQPVALDWDEQSSVILENTN